MNGSKNCLSYWDSGIFLAWFTAENRSQADTTGLRHLVEEFDTGRSQICVSTLLFVEVLEARLSGEAQMLLRGLSAKRNLHFFDLTPPIARRAAELRYHYSNKPDNLPGLSTPDAIHLATATMQKCEVFYTFDSADKPQKQRGLLGLNDYFYGTYGMRIERPRAGGQISLELSRG